MTLKWNKRCHVCKYINMPDVCSSCVWLDQEDFMCDNFDAVETIEILPTDDMWICPNCGLEVHTDYDRCVRCGERREDGEEE